MIPERMRRLPMFHGMPIPYSVFVSDEGVPDFRVVDQLKMRECVERELCVLCGQRLGRRKVFIGGPASMKHGVFFDGPMHEECARYSAATCPFLNGTHGQHADTKQVERHHAGDQIAIQTMASVVEGRPEQMGYYFTFGYTWRDGFYRANPAIRVEWF